MMVVPSVAQLWIYPVKSLDGVAVEMATVLPSGALQGDREFALHDEAGQFVNGKRHPRIHALRTQFDQSRQTLTLTPGAETTPPFHLITQRPALEQWLSQYFQFPIALYQNTDMGFPDDTAAPGPTIVSTATLEAIAAWFPDCTVDEVRRRFRSNIEITGVPAFWEDQLFSANGDPVSFQIGDVTLWGINPCQRCVVVTRNSRTGAPDRHFQTTFSSHRQATFPTWAPRSRFNHFFRLAVNTQIPDAAGKSIRVGDPLRFTATTTTAL